MIAVEARDEPVSDHIIHIPSTPPIDNKKFPGWNNIQISSQNASAFIVQVLTEKGKKSKSGTP